MNKFSRLAGFLLSSESLLSFPRIRGFTDMCHNDLQKLQLKPPHFLSFTHRCALTTHARSSLYIKGVLLQIQTLKHNK